MTPAPRLLECWQAAGDPKTTMYLEAAAKGHSIAKPNIQIKNPRIRYCYACTHPARVFLWC